MKKLIAGMLLMMVGVGIGMGVGARAARAMTTDDLLKDAGNPALADLARLAYVNGVADTLEAVVGYQTTMGSDWIVRQQARLLRKGGLRSDLMAWAKYMWARSNREARDYNGAAVMMVHACE
jgi:hypothetical protein